jgi:hypothetical protein
LAKQASGAMMITLPTIKIILVPKKPIVMQRLNVKFTGEVLGLPNQIRPEAGLEHLLQRPNEAMGSVFDLYGRPEMPMYQHEDHGA